MTVPSIDPEDQRVQRLCLLTVLKSLDASQRAIVRLLWIGFTEDEICQRLHLRRGAYRRALVRLRKLFRAALEGR